ncbi:MAG: hypothetical protein EOM73_14275, partial [Bacteroidia bacterium]|nr:hypothetical protein [Bacteroidia bacterium]
MKTKNSGNGVKVANRNQVVKSICKNYWSDTKVSRLKSAEMLAYWDYKAEGLTLLEAKTQLLQAIGHRATVQKLRDKNNPPAKKQPGRILRMLEAKRNSIKLFVKSCEKYDPAMYYFRYSYGNYQYQQRTFVVPEIDHNGFPVTATIGWREDHDWDYYAKRYGRPKSTYSDRKVLFQSIGKLGQVENIFTFDLNNFAGNFMEKAIAGFQRVKKGRCPKGLKAIQMADYFTVKKLKSVNGYQLFQRYIGKVPWDYAILETKTGENYHAYDMERLIPGLRTKMQARIEHENEAITKKTAFRLGFCQSGVRAFCEHN